MESSIYDVSDIFHSFEALFVHLQVHSRVHFKSAALHLHLPLLHVVLHPHLTNSLVSLIASFCDCLRLSSFLAPNLRSQRKHVSRANYLFKVKPPNESLGNMMSRSKDLKNTNGFLMLFWRIML